ncbi:uncharacterized protein LOC131632079 [Vicia villosa]|uniref:uncharacterized protein LOC131632079 n=1 Tax=Vicia villosa TaxID=3911 RepID=UPI00273B3D8D|nr:uncharacterized protein LOC131632079 [Vicia villosa]
MQVFSQVTNGASVPTDATDTPIPKKADIRSPFPPPGGIDLLHEEANAPEALVDYPGGPSDLSLLTGYVDRTARHVWDGEDRVLQKFYNHDRKIVSLVQPTNPWFQDILTASGMKDLFQIGYSTIYNGTLMGTLLGHGRLTKEEAREALIKELGANPEDALENVERTRDTHMRFSFLTRQYEAELHAAQQATGALVEVERHIQRANLGYDKRQHWSTTTIDSERDACGRQGLWLGWKLQHFPVIIGWGEVLGYTEAMPHASVFIPIRGNQVSDPYKKSLNRMAAEDI